MSGYLRSTTKTFLSSTSASAPGQHPSGSSGEYWIEFTFGPHPILLSVATEDVLRRGFVGDTHIVVSEPLDKGVDRKNVMTIELVGKDRKYHFFCNGSGRLSHVNTLINAKNFNSAIAEARKGLEPLLAGWSVRYNAPIHVFRIRALEQETSTERSILFYDFYPFTTIAPAELNRIFWFPSDFRGLEYYREALCSTSPKYQFLCYFKALELASALRRKRAAAAKRQGKNVPRAQETVPDESWFRTHLTPEIAGKVIGKKFNAIINDDLRPMRNTVAHGLLDGDLTGFLSDDQVLPWLPVVKLIAEHLVVAEAREQQAAGAT